MLVFEWSGPLEPLGMVLFLAFMLFVAGSIFWPYLSGEEVGSVRSSVARKGVALCTSGTIGVRRLRGGRRWVRIRITCVTAGGLRHAQRLERSEASDFARLLEEAAEEVRKPPMQEERALGNAGSVGVGIFRDRDGQGWVTLTWSANPIVWRTCLARAAVQELAKLVRIGSQPGDRLEDAKRAWWRELDRRKRAAERLPAPREMQS